MFSQFANVARYEIAGFLAALALLIGYQLMTGAIATAGLLSRSKDGGPSANEVQLLFLTLLAAGTYLLQVMSVKEHKFPDIPPEILALFVASHSVYNGANGLSALADWLKGRSRPEGK